MESKKKKRSKKSMKNNADSSLNGNEWRQKRCLLSSELQKWNAKTSKSKTDSKEVEGQVYERKLRKIVFQ